MRVYIVFLLLLLSSCSLIQQQGIRVTAGIVSQGSYEVETDGNLVFLEKALPANLKLVESMLYLDPNNKKLLATLTKGYVGYAFAINETNFLREQLADVENGPAWHQAILNYSKGLEYGIRYLNLRGISYHAIANNMGDNGYIPKLLDEKLDVDDSLDFEVVFYTAQALGSLINLQKGNLKLIAQLPVVKSLFDWSCGYRPNFNFGACQIFYASYSASRPRALGGNPQQGKKLFLAAIKKWPENNLIKIAYLQYYVVPMMVEDEFNHVAHMLPPSVSISWEPDQIVKQRDHLKLFNSIAQKRFMIIQKFKDEIF